MNKVPLALGYALTGTVFFGACSNVVAAPTRSAVLHRPALQPPDASHAPPPDDSTDPLYNEAQKAHRSGDNATAFKDFTQAAQAGNPDAQAMLGQMYQNGEGVTRDYAAAKSWYDKAAHQDNSRALQNLGLMYRQGVGVTKDAQTALEYFMAAKALGDMKAARYIGLTYEEAGDNAKAAIYYQQGAARGDITSQFYLGRAYEQGKGIKRNYGLAAQWYSKSAERGDIIASDGMVGLASLYERGLGVPKNIQKATALYQQAASVGNEKAKASLQRMGIKTG